jgi:hypothetical protein
MASGQSSVTEQAPTSVRVEIASDGHFVGGDRERAADIVLELLGRPKELRRVEVQASPLDDQNNGPADPDTYAKLRDGVRVYESALNLLFHGGVYYRWQWKHSELVEAVLELRRIALPAQYDREWWYVWPMSEPAELLGCY